MDLGREAAAAHVSAASVSAAAASISTTTGCKVGGEPGKGVKTKGNKWRREGMKVGNRKFCCIARSKLAKLLRAVRQRKEGARRSKEQMWGARILDEEEQQGRHDGRKSLVLSPPEPPLPPQPRPLWEQLEEILEGMHKRNREMAGRMHAQGGARGGERPEGQGKG